MMQAVLDAIYEIPISDIDEFPNHPFLIHSEEEMDELVNSIKSYGVLVPTIVRKKDDGRYEMISGHRRMLACTRLGINTIPAEIKELSRDEAIICMVDSNLHREILLPSERAFSLKMKMEAMNRQGTRTDLTSVQYEQKLDNRTSRKRIADELGISESRVQRYIRLTFLIPELLAVVDAGKMALGPAERISYLPQEFQTVLYREMSFFEDDLITPSYSQAVAMKNAYDAEKLSVGMIREIMEKPKANQKDRIVLHNEIIKQYVPDKLSVDATKRYVIEALKQYQKLQLDEGIFSVRNNNRIREKLPRGISGEKAEEFILKALDTYNRILEKKKDRDSR